MNKYYESVADIFCQHGIDRCFALLGDANMHWAGAMHERGVKFVYTRHEHAAVAAATAYFAVLFAQEFGELKNVRIGSEAPKPHGLVGFFAPWARWDFLPVVPW